MTARGGTRRDLFRAIEHRDEEIARLRAEVERLRKDSERLNFLLDEGFVPALRLRQGVWELEVDYGRTVVTGDDPDEAIDAAIEHATRT